MKTTGLLRSKLHYGLRCSNQVNLVRKTLGIKYLDFPGSISHRCSVASFVYVGQAGQISTVSTQNHKELSKEVFGIYLSSHFRGMKRKHFFSRGNYHFAFSCTTSVQNEPIPLGDSTNIHNQDFLGPYTGWVKLQCRGGLDAETEISSRILDFLSFLWKMVEFLVLILCRRGGHPYMYLCQ